MIEPQDLFIAPDQQEKEVKAPMMTKVIKISLTEKNWTFLIVRKKVILK
jgi:hypothetical protein